MTRDVIRALGRRWYVLVAGLLMTAGLAYGAYRIAPPSYTASGLVLLLPSTSTVGLGGNPLLALSDLDQPAEILVAYFSGASAQADVKANAPTAQYVVSINSSTRGPIIEVDVTDKTPAKTLGALDYITNQIPVELHGLQTAVSAPPDAVITSMPLTIDAKAKADYAATIRTMIAAVLVGLVVTGVIAFALDGLLLGRQARKRARAEAVAHVPAEPIDPEEPTETSRPSHTLHDGAAMASSSADENGDLDPDPDPDPGDMVAEFIGPVPAAARQEP
ncbi:hypothetical protein G3T36_02840 [Diaminobutyricibacter tongyongensis]|uniref:Polysaccharide chain length determinant N-terminal domain-containing protein n=1 Tax=Leifsonia tongyongensis TaxID=1268043 RepID=A0A6L9XUV9_9MICO|nr:hypothetical protein [Diaminobutyricibacter tongyongensis]NEN04798.1 hypothetical protein [Diaminobutyricibacter tongyongensis]